ncbi:MAG: PAS domain S-box protein, partial [Deltaproteobacteria bacterium]|nr:PAS domain S-box protein [Deltaproteobacteria bacterium]
MTGARILVVEDEIIIARDIQAKLRTLGYDVPDPVYSGEDAVIKAGEHQPDLVLMDIVIKGDVDGIEAAREIYSRFAIPVVYLTAYADDKTLARAKVTEPFGYILKPYEERELHSSIEMALYRNEMNRALRRSEEKYRTILENIEDGYFEVDLAGNFQFFNDSLCRILGYEEREIRGLNNRAYMNEENARKVYASFNQIYRTAQPADILDIEIIQKSGEHRLMEASVSPIMNSGDKPVGFRGIARDVTERRRSAEELRKSYERLQLTLEGVIYALASVVEIRDSYTADHQKRVAQLAVAIGEEMGLDRNHIEGLRLASVIHDIGKITVPAEILSKPGRLNETEFALVKSHPQAGYEILKGIEFPWPIADIVLQHHERLDGSGYSSGRKNDEILLEARILAVADVFEAIMSHRPYRPALGVDFAINELEQKKGIAFDRDAAEICISLFRDRGFTLQ